jgi:hypothetical protein
MRATRTEVMVEADGTTYQPRIYEFEYPSREAFSKRIKERLAAMGEPTTAYKARLPNGFCYVDRLEDFYIFVSITEEN